MLKLITCEADSIHRRRGVCELQRDLESDLSCTYCSLLSTQKIRRTVRLKMDIIHPRIHTSFF